MDGQVPHDLLVWVRVGEADRPLEVAEKGHIRHRGDEPRGQSGSRDRNATSLAAADHRDPVGIDLRKGAYGIHRTDGVREHPSVVVVLRALDAACHESARGGTGAVRVGGGPTAAPHRPLSAGIHEQIDIAGRNPSEALYREAAATAVAVELHDGRQRPRSPGGREHPCLHGVSREAGERDVEDLERAQRRVGRLDERLTADHAGLVEGRRPEVVEIGGLPDRRSVALKLVEGQVESGHENSVCDCRHGNDRHRSRSRQHAEPSAVPHCPPP